MIQEAMDDEPDVEIPPTYKKIVVHFMQKEGSISLIKESVLCHLMKLHRLLILNIIF